MIIFFNMPKRQHNKNQCTKADTETSKMMLCNLLHNHTSCILVYSSATCLSNLYYHQLPTGALIYKAKWFFYVTRHHMSFLGMWTIIHWFTVFFLGSHRPHFTGVPLAKRHCTALCHATNYWQVAGDAGVRTVSANVLFECPRCLGRRDNGTYDWSMPLRKLKSDQSPAANMRSTRSFWAVISTS